MLKFYYGLDDHFREELQIIEYKLKCEKTELDER